MMMILSGFLAKLKGNMNKVKPIGIGLLGAGTIGAGVINALEGKSDLLTERIGRPVKLMGILVRNASNHHASSNIDLPFTENAEALITSDDVDIIIEVLGGEHPAIELINLAIKSNKHVVTANKEVMAKHGMALLHNANKEGVLIGYEGSVGGGIPIISALTHQLATNEISAVQAIINGTTNYILSNMSAGGASFNAALNEAQMKGFAEADSSYDVNGDDAAYKLAILSSVAFRSAIHDEDVFREGIESIGPEDFIYAKELGYCIKLLAISKLEGQFVRARVHPSLIPMDHPLAQVNGVDNAIELEGDLVEWSMLQGPGAGSGPTTSAILGDVINIGQKLDSAGLKPNNIEIASKYKSLPLDDLETKYYLRLHVKDLPGVMAKISRVLGDMNVSLATVIQKEIDDEAESTAEIVITTHKSLEKSMQNAIKQLKSLDVINAICSFIRIEDSGFSKS